jgi:bifunctional DNA-binding transcriptional regulator/antitoxin component of YhaV-PrlF toxin-antitoxin module
VRDKLRLKPGDSVVWLEEEGRVVLAKPPSAASADPVDDPFAAFGEWASEADAKGFAKL